MLQLNNAANIHTYHYGILTEMNIYAQNHIIFQQMTIPLPFFYEPNESSLSYLYL